MEYVIATCRAEDLDRIDVKCRVKKYEAGKKCAHLLPGAKTVYVVGNPETNETDVCKKGIIADDFPSYKASREKAKEIAVELKEQGYKAKVTVGISIKNACVLSGVGVYGKNALIINPKYGTRLRFACVLTDYVPEEYGEPLKDFSPCGDCKLCILSCPGNCLEPYKVDGPKCNCTYIEKGQKVLQTLPMCSKCQDVCPWNNSDMREAVQRPHTEAIKEEGNS